MTIINLTLVSTAILLYVSNNVAKAFIPHHSITKTGNFVTPLKLSLEPHSQYRQPNYARRHEQSSNFLLWLSSEDNNDDATAVTSMSDSSDAEVATPPATTTGTSSSPVSSGSGSTAQAADYPLNVPSPLLLASTIILAIASVGSLFDLTSGNGTQFGFGVTAAIAALGLPLSLFLFYASIKKAIAETDEDDKAYRQGR
mmetsp:Transcript_2254/g.2900  ORF Transcript_2254/g.2900 Transcript_2254/m.2900 type:complete len:199 (+) Transcript_2254:105-701(+)|eukprot:CAMPEP_0172499866 /NCGR_PEP_ID=MMETSP1066-20121228/132084_1 /TAXON_ID=671091 /ORGANISM="Coscinodiscus wailesii, Strain CCMP2513" /LENGTH=198 /DNA_ID=CAMNT_0013273841 /DNA_START=93 /DNA_END=689 /DNA_ORIENTATION=+